MENTKRGTQRKSKSQGTVKTGSGRNGEIDICEEELEKWKKEMEGRMRYEKNTTWN